jgi:hypothetical protein
VDVNEKPVEVLGLSQSEFQFSIYPNPSADLIYIRGETKDAFNLTTQMGMEYTLEIKNKLRLGTGHIHQSNNELLDPNPGEDGNGFNITYLCSWKN